MNWVITPPLDPNKSYFWRVRSRDAAGTGQILPEISLIEEAELSTPAGNPSAFSTPIKFTVDTILPGASALRAPIGLVNDNTPLFDWDASTGNVIDYRLQVVNTGGDFNGQSLVLDQVVLQPTTEFQSTVNLADGNYDSLVKTRFEEVPAI